MTRKRKAQQGNIGDKSVTKNQDLSTFEFPQQYKETKRKLSTMKNQIGETSQFIGQRPFTKKPGLTNEQLDHKELKKQEIRTMRSISKQLR